MGLWNPPPMLHEADTLVFSGGGIRGVAFAGALAALEESSMAQGHSDPYSTIRNISGTSAGALVGLYIAVGANAEALDKALTQLRGVMAPLDAASFIRLASEYGMDDGEGLRHLVRDALEWGGLSPDYTFAELHRSTGKRLCVTATRMPDGAPMRFGFETTPEISVMEAVVASMSVPVLFTPCMVGDTLCCDGGLVDNMPLMEAIGGDSRRRVLGLRLMRGSSSPPSCVTSAAPVHMPPPDHQPGNAAVTTLMMGKKKKEEVTAAMCASAIASEAASLVRRASLGVDHRDSEARHSVSPVQYFSGVLLAPLERLEQLELSQLSPEARASVITIDTGDVCPVDFTANPSLWDWLRDRGRSAASAYSQHALAMRYRSDCESKASPCDSAANIPPPTTGIATGMTPERKINKKKNKNKNKKIKWKKWEKVKRRAPPRCRGLTTDNNQATSSPGWRTRA